MLDILQASPDIITQAADSTSFITEPMRAILDSISIKTGQTALNTARDSVDWEVINITKRDYYIAIVAILVATVSLIVDIFTTIYQHTSSANSKLLSAKHTFPVQKQLAIDMIVSMFNKALILYSVKQHLIQCNFTKYPLNVINAEKIYNRLDLDAICAKNTEFLKRWCIISYNFQVYNSDCDTLIDILKNPRLSPEIKTSFIDEMIKNLIHYCNHIFTLFKDMNDQGNLADGIIKGMKAFHLDDHVQNNTSNITGAQDLKNAMSLFIYMLRTNSSTSVKEIEGLVNLFYRYRYNGNYIMVPTEE